MTSLGINIQLTPMRHTLIVLFLLLCSASGVSQHGPVPAYLITQDFPDSVRSLGITNLSGNRITFGQMLESYKGKRILVDIWASWCGDCITGYPKLDDLRNNKWDKDLVVVFLSVDKDADKWKNAIHKYKIRGDHYLVDNNWKNALSNYLVLDWVPRYFVLDAEGRIIMPKAITADDPLLSKTLMGK